MFEPDSRSEDRASSEVVATALLIGIVVLSVSAILLGAGTQLNENQNSVEVKQAERGLTQFDAGAARVATGSSPSQAVDLGLKGNSGTLDVRNDSGRMTVTYVTFPNGSTTDVMNTSLGTVIYENGDTTVGYQGGGVWRSDGDASTMVSPPEVTFTGKTLAVNAIETERGGSVHSELQISRRNAVERYPNATAGLTNRVRGAKIRNTIQSRYYRAWGEFLEEETGTIVQYDHSERTVTAVYPSEGTGPSAFPSGIVATSGNGYLELAGKGAYSDSYSSDSGPYASPGNKNGTIVAAGDVRTTGNSSVYGDVWSGSTVLLDGKTSVSGDVYWTDDYEQKGAAVSGSDENISGVASVAPIDAQVEEQVEANRASNDNDNTSTITNEEISITNDGGDGLPNGTLTAGDYYVDRLNLSGEQLILDTSDGNISLAVGEYILMERGGKGDKGSNITVKGDGVARIYVASDRKILIEKSGKNTLDRDRNLSFYVSIDSEVYVPENRAPQLRVFGTREFTMAMAGSDSKPTYFNGYVYAPAGRDGSGYAYYKHAELYGGVVTGNLTIGQSAAIHYDTALSERTIPQLPGISRIEYLYVTESRVEVADR